jgi:hypothetical protein
VADGPLGRVAPSGFDSARGLRWADERATDAARPSRAGRHVATVGL